MIEQNFLNRQVTDALKGVAIWLVITMHILPMLEPAVPHEPVRFLTPTGGIGVAIFLFLSGYGLQESHLKSGLDNYWTKRILRVVIPWAIFITFVQLLHPEDFDLLTYLLDVACLKTPYWWYIGFAMKWYIIFWISRKWLGGYGNFFMIICAMAMFVTMENLKSQQSMSFLAGVLVSQWKLSICEMPKKRICEILCGIAAIGILFLLIKQLPIIRSFGADSIVMKLVELLIKLPLGIGIVGLIQFAPPHCQEKGMWSVIWRAMLFTGIISYELYIIHMEVLSWTDDKLVNVVVLLVISYLLSYSFCHLCRYLTRRIQTYIYK